jgi:hypothetical protein
VQWTRYLRELAHFHSIRGAQTESFLFAERNCSPSALKIGLKRSRDCYQFRPIVSSAAMIERHNLQLRSDSARRDRIRFFGGRVRAALIVRRSTFTLIPDPNRPDTASGRNCRPAPRSFCFHALRVSAFGILCKERTRLPNLPKKHSLPLGGRALAALRVVCPGRIHPGTKRRFQR